MKRSLALLLSGFVAAPPSAWAQAAKVVVPEIPVSPAGVSAAGASLGSGVSLSNPTIFQRGPAVTGITNLAIAPSVFRAPRMAPLRADGLGASDKSANALKAAELALSGDPEAGKEKPAMAGLGAKVDAPKADASDSQASAAGTEAFDAKTGVKGVKTGDAVEVPAASNDNPANDNKLEKPERPPELAKDKAKALPAPTVVQSSLPDLDSAVEMYVSHSYPGAPGSDPATLMAEAVDEYIAFKGMPDSEKHFVFKFYEIGMHPTHKSKVVTAIERLVAAGIKTTILTDLNPSLTGKFKKDENRNTRYEKAEYKESGPGRATKHFIEELGFTYEYGKGKFTILSGEPLFHPEDTSQKPLMHDKGVFALGPEGKAYRFSWNGTSNMNAIEEKTEGEHPAYGGRYNRVIKSKDPVSNEHDWKHVLAEIESYNDREGHKGLGDEQDIPNRVTYPNGEFRETAFTNGTQNPNERQVLILNRAIKSLEDALARREAGEKDAKPDFEVNEVIFSDFVLTYIPVVEATRHWLGAALKFYGKDEMKNHVKVTGVFDQQFIAPDGWGAAASMDGMLVQRPMGKSIFPFRSEFVAVTKLYAYIRLLGGTDKIDPDGAPSRVHLWHDKTTVIKTVERDAAGKETRWVDAFTRSLNNSGHFQSLESQDWYHLTAVSKLAMHFEDSIIKVAENEPEYAKEFDVAVVMSVLAHTTGHTIYDEGMYEQAKALTASLTDRDYTAVAAVMEVVMGLPTKNIKPVDMDAVRDGVARYVNFLYWYDQKAKEDRSLNRMSYRKALNIGLGMAGKSPYGLRTALNILFWKPNQDEAELNKLMREAWKKGLKMPTSFPGDDDSKGTPQAPSA
ncbi:MAG: hypothetical protein HY925_04395 [Elusimicrobia bacterium]|nr:hypothetical protein [Elusimicrobiota bacterium]